MYFREQMPSSAEWRYSFYTGTVYHGRYTSGKGWYTLWAVLVQGSVIPWMKKSVWSSKYILKTEKYITCLLLSAENLYGNV